MDKDKDKIHAFTGGYAKVPEAADKAALPGLDTEYKAAANPDNAEVCRLIIILGAEGFAPGGAAYLALQYVHIDLGELGFLDDGQVFSFTFSGLRPKLVVVHGRDLLRIYDYISLRRMPWIRQADRGDFRPADGGGEPVITKIEVLDWKRPKTQAKELAEELEAHGEEEFA